MKKYVIYALLLTLILAGCAGNKKNDKKPNETTAVTGTETVTVSVDQTTAPAGETEKKEEIALPPIPETGIPEIPGAIVIHTDTEALIEISPEGTTYVNGIPIVGEFADLILSQQQNKHKTTTTTKIQYTPGTTTEKENKVTESMEIISVETVETLSEGSYFIGDEEDFEEIVDGTLINQGGTIIEDTVKLAKYVDSGNTDLNIKEIMVYSQERPGVDNIDSFKPGDTAIVNLWCNAEFRYDAELYVVSTDTEHKSSYEKDEYITKCELYTAFEDSSGMIVFEVSLPEGIPSHIYEFRFVCGGEEGYIPFHIG